MQMAATEGIVGSPGFGRIPLAHRAVTFPGVSEPSSVVRSMQRTARSRAQSFEDFLIERLAREAARSSAPTSSTLRTPRMSEPMWVSERAVAAIGIMRRPGSYPFVRADGELRRFAHLLSVGGDGPGGGACAGAVGPGARGRRCWCAGRRAVHAGA